MRIERIELIHLYDIKIHLAGGRIIDSDIYSLQHGGTIYGLAMNPRLYVDGDVEGKLVLIDEKNAHYVWNPREDSKKKELIERLLRNEPVKLSELLPYGKWELWDIADIVWKRDGWVPLALTIGTSILITDAVQKEIYEKVGRGEIISMDSDVRTIGDLMYPVYYRKVENVEKWIVKHLPNVALNTYKAGLIEFVRAKREERKMNTRDLSREEKELENLMRILRVSYPVPEVELTKFDYVSLYINHDDFVHAITTGLMDVLYKDEGMDFIRPEDREYIGDYKSHFFRYLKVIRGVEKRKEYGVWEI